MTVSLGAWIPKKGALVGLLGGAIALVALPAWACQRGTPVAPSAESRLFRSDRHGLSVEIPANYRTVLRNSGDITFHDPVSFEYVQCLVRRGRYGRPPLHAVLEVSPVADPNLGLVELVRRRRPWVDFYQPSFTPVEINGRPAVRYQYTQEITGAVMVNVSLRSPDGRYLITVSGPQAEGVAERAIATLQFL